MQQINQEYQPELWSVRKDYIYSAIAALKKGLVLNDLMVADYRLKYNERTNPVINLVEKAGEEMEKAVLNLCNNCPESRPERDDSGGWKS